LDRRYHRSRNTSGWPGGRNHRPAEQSASRSTCKPNAQHGSGAAFRVGACFTQGLSNSSSYEAALDRRIG
jgi:hypothetical protein